MVAGRLILSVLSLGASFAAADCSYASLTSVDSVITADSNCNTKIAKTCIIAPNNCTPFDLPYNDKYDSFSGVTAIGDMTNYPNTDLVLANSTSVDFTKMILPPTLQMVGFDSIGKFSMSQLAAVKWPALKELDFANCSLSGIPGGFSFPKGVQTLVWSDNAFHSLPSGIPSSVQIIAFQGNYISDLTGIPTGGLLKINFHGNSLKQVTNMDWSSATLIRLGSNPLTTFSNVQLSSAITFFDIQDCSISNFTVNLATFDALDSLSAWDNDKTKYTGFVATSSIYTSSSSCSAINGQIKSLWSGKTSYTFNVCVTGGSSSSTSNKGSKSGSTNSDSDKNSKSNDGMKASSSSSGSNTSVIIGLLIGAAILIAAIVFYILKRKKKTELATPELQEYQYQAPTTFDEQPRAPSIVVVQSSAPKAEYDPSQFASTQGFEYNPSNALTTAPVNVSNNTNNTGSSGSRQSTGGVTTNRSSTSDTDIILDVSLLRHHKLELSDLVVISEKPLASGGFGEVWLGQYGNEKVAIKRIKDKSPNSVYRFIEEIKLMTRMESDYIVAFVGASWRRPIDMECVVEYMDLGDLRNYLVNHPPAMFTWEEKYQSILSIVRGLIYLHTFSPPIIHRDLKSRNVLLDTKKGTKLTDFGSSREIDESTLTNGIGTYQWMAPEIIMSTEYTTAADVYSFGILLSEFSTHLVPFSDLINPGTNKPWSQQYILTHVTTGSLKPSFDTTTTPSWVHEMAMVCLNVNPALRPTSLQLAAMLQKYK